MSLDLEQKSGFRRHRRPTAGHAVTPGWIMLKIVMAAAALIAAIYVWRGLRGR
jgi:uncharacterized membrane protein (DUF485 family)